MLAGSLIAQDGAGLFNQLCASCHQPATYRDRPAETILKALESGPMLQVTASIAPLERRALAEFASGRKLNDGFSLKPIPQATCGVDPGTVVDASRGPVWNGAGPNARFQSAPGFTAAQVPKLKLQWAFAFPGEVSSDAHVSIAGGRLFTGSHSGLVYSLEAQSGCIHWIFQAESWVKAAITVARIGTINGPRDFAFLADGLGNVYALDAATGRFLWKTKAEGAGAGSPVLSNGRLYIPAGKSLVALDAATGKQLWRSETNAPLRSAPLVDAKAVYANGGELAAFDLATGKRLWSIADAPGVPLLAPLASGRRALIVDDGAGLVRAFDPDKAGATLWQSRIGSGTGGQWGPAADAQNVYAALPGESGGLFALRLLDGRRAWPAAAPKCGTRPRCGPSQAPTAIPGVVFSGSADGHIRAFAAGRSLWDFDTAREFETINAVPGRGGSLGGPGPVVAGGMLYVNSGYALAGGEPGNVLLAFGPPTSVP